MTTLRDRLSRVNHLGRIKLKLLQSLNDVSEALVRRSPIASERKSDVLEEAESMMSGELAASRLSRAWRTRKAIEAALAKLSAGTYGLCESCGSAINARRLEAIPWAALCTSCQSSEEVGNGENREYPYRSGLPEHEADIYRLSARAQDLSF
jgi:RNA polymerase-binding transcription factor DksA